jgi:hypothetical protein
MQVIIENLKQTSLFELFKIKHVINKILDDPIKLSEIRNTLRLNQQIRYFDTSLNSEITAVIEKINKNTIFARNTHDGKLWTIPFYMLNVTGVEHNLNDQNNKVDRFNLKVGDAVGFLNHRNNEELYGIVVKLNQKTATVKLSTGEQWLVYYQSLFYVVNSNNVFFEVAHLEEVQ